MRGRITSRTVRSPKRSASIATRCSTDSSTPSCVPVSIMCSMSTSDTLGSVLVLRTRSTNSTASLARPMNQTNGRATIEIQFSTGATMRASTSACRKRQLLGNQLAQEQRQKRDADDHNPQRNAMGMMGQKTELAIEQSDRPAA